MKISATTVAVMAAVVSTLGQQVQAWEDTCSQFKDIYTDGTDLCERMWDDSFEVVDDLEPGYTMWFFDHDVNPNDAVTRSIFGVDSQPEECHLQYFHKDVPSSEDDAMTECHPWKNNACCDSETVKSAKALNEGYGPGYEWDRCGPMSQACERFFVQEACLYECEPAAGLYRKFNKTQQDHPDYNQWQMYKMPIKKSFCNSWYDACANDYFCGGGSFFGCDAFYWENLAAEQNATKLAKEQDELAKEQDRLFKEEELGEASKAQIKELMSQNEEDKESMSQNEEDSNRLVIGLSVAGAIAVLWVLMSLMLIRKEKKGDPMFAPLERAAAGVST